MTRYMDGYGRTRRLNAFYGQIQLGIAARGGAMYWERPGYPHGAWIIKLEGKEKVFASEGKGWYKGLDELLVPKPGVKSPKSWSDLSHDMVPGAIDKLVAMLKPVS